ncbi:MAG: TlpA family protein disulfide reductase [Natronosporangium sp.]
MGTAVLALVLASGCASEDATGRTDAVNGKSYVSGPGVVSVVAARDRRPAPRIRGELLDGGRFDLAEHAGKIVVFNVWGSWCPPCRAEAPALKQVAEETRPAGVQFVGINIRDNRQSARAFERRFAIPYPSIFDPDGLQLLQFRTSLPPQAIPSTVVIDRQGRVAARIVGATTYLKLRRLLDDILAERPA